MYGRFLKNEKGSAFLMAVIGIGVLSVITLGAIFMGSTNEKQTHREGKRTQAYYVADVGAKTMIEELKKLPADKLKAKLVEMKNKGVIEGTYTDDTTSSSSNEWRFEIQVVETSENVYELRSTGYTEDGTGVDAKDGTRVIIPLEEKGSTGYNIGDGKIFLNKKDGDANLQLPFIPQLTGHGVSIYTGMTKSGDKEPIFINDGDASELFSRDNNQDVATLNKQKRKADTGGNYILKVLEPKSGKISSSNPIKKEQLIKDPIGETIEFNYDSQKEEIIKYFSMEQLSGSGLSSIEIEKGIEKIFMLPIYTKADYDEYMSGNKLYPDSKMETYPLIGSDRDDTTLKNMTSSSPLKSQVSHDLRGKKHIKLPELSIAEGGKLNIQVDNGTNIYIDGNLRINDASKSPEFNIKTDGVVNVYIKGDAQPDGNIRVEGGVANFYMNGKTFQTNNKAKIIGVNLYNPTGEVLLGNNIEFEGVIVCKHIQFKDNATFRAPSKGGASSSMNKEWELGDLEWKEWKQ